MISISAHAFHHRGLGDMIRLSLGDKLAFSLTPLEARTLSRALAAVQTGKAKVDEVYMSPIASDQDFFGKVLAEGLMLECQPPLERLDWLDIAKIAGLLAELAPEPSET